MKPLDPEALTADLDLNKLNLQLHALAAENRQLKAKLSSAEITVLAFEKISRENGAWREKSHKLETEINSLVKQREDAQAKLAQVEADALRMNWLDTQRGHIRGTDYPIWKVDGQREDMNGGEPPDMTIRQAIDEAMEKEGK